MKSPAVEKIEPEARAIIESPYADLKASAIDLSIAISLRRIADVLEGGAGLGLVEAIRFAITDSIQGAARR